MYIKQLSEVIFTFYNNGKNQATNQALKQKDIEQYTKVAFGNIMRRIYYTEKKNQRITENFFISTILSSITFTLTEATSNGMRRADMSKFDLYRLPENAHIVNVYPLGCGNEQGKSLSQVAAGEEYFYLGAEYRFFKFFTIKGRGINTYNIESCVKEVEIEATFDIADVDVSFDLCYDVATEVLGVALRLPEWQKRVDNSYSAPQHDLRQKIGAPQQPNLE
jgi:hypothetical protein